MTKKELKERVELGVCVRGHFKVTITYRGRKYTCTSDNTYLYDIIESEGSDYPMKGVRNALDSLYFECKMRNGLIKQM